MKARIVSCVSGWMIVLATSAFGAGATWWVDAGAAPGGDGSAGAPFDRIQTAIDAATDGDAVHVLPGTYLERIDFQTKSISVRGLSGPSSTVIHAARDGSVVRMSGVDQVLQGFTVENGSAELLGAPSHGGGILMNGASGAQVIGCVVRNNFATMGDGIAALSSTGVVLETVIEHNGGIGDPTYCSQYDNGGGVWANSPLTLDHCTIRSNTASINGGGAYGVTLLQCTVTGNSAAEGAGIAACYALDSDISGNSAYSCDGSFTAAGGAIGSTLERCTVAHNSSWDTAGGVWHCTLRHCVVSGNHVAWPYNWPGMGGGALDSTLEDCLVENNSISNPTLHVPSSGGGARGGSALRTIFRGNYAEVGAGVSGVALDRCVVFDNAGLGVSGGSVRNSIVLENAAGQVGDGAAVSYSNVHGGYAGVGNIDAPPCFWNAHDGDFHLQAISPCIDAGDPTVSDPDGSRVDMGVFPFSRDDCLPAVVYCPKGKSSEGCEPQLELSGSTSLTQASGLLIQAGHLSRERMALVLYGVNGVVETPWGSSSYSCVAPPRQRTGSVSTGAATDACGGTITLDFHVWRTTHPFALGVPFTAGDAVWTQVWYRDPNSTKGTNFTEALRFMLCE